MPSSGPSTCSTGVGISKTLGHWRGAGFVDLASWQREFTWRRRTRRTRRLGASGHSQGKPETDSVVLLKLNAAELDEIRTASQRPYAVFKIHVEESFRALLPELAVIKSFRLRVSGKGLGGSLAAGNPECSVCRHPGSAGDGEAVRSEPMLIAALVRVACVSLRCNHSGKALRAAVVDGATRAVPDAVERDQPRGADVPQSARERAFSIAVIDLMKHDPKALDAPGEEGLESAPCATCPPAGSTRTSSPSRGCTRRLTRAGSGPSHGDLARASQTMKEFEDRLRRKSPYMILASMLFSERRQSR